ncbi:MAG: TetR family transcriptional regulator [Rhodococcus ruber]|nr:TetR family transcriptional regulator [Rhodococcus ruber]
MAQPRRRLDPEQRRAQLLDIGARLFAERAYDDVWIEEVAELAGVSRGLMYHYFPTKRDFMAAVVQRESDRLLAVTEPDPRLTVAERITAGLDAYLDYVASHRQGVAAEVEGRRVQVGGPALLGKARVDVPPELREAEARYSGNGEAAVTLGTAKLEGVYKGRPLDFRYRFTNVWVRRDGRWVDVGWHLDNGPFVHRDGAWIRLGEPVPEPGT